MRICFENCSPAPKCTRIAKIVAAAPAPCCLCVREKERVGGRERAGEREREREEGKCVRVCVCVCDTLTQSTLSRFALASASLRRATQRDTHINAHTLTYTIHPVPVRICHSVSLYCATHISTHTCTHTHAHTHMHTHNSTCLGSYLPQRPAILRELTA